MRIAAMETQDQGQRLQMGRPYTKLAGVTIQNIDGIVVNLLGSETEGVEWNALEYNMWLWIKQCK